MADLDRYRKKADTAVTAVRLAFDFDGFTYRKWGAEQHCKAGDWVVDNEGSVYTVDSESFRRTYEMVSPGRYQKTACVWAKVATTPGTVQTKEGATGYAVGDYLVSNGPDGEDAYAVSRDAFERMYELAPEDTR